MKSQRRWMKWVLEMTASETVEMPWQRGARREAFIARRSTTPLRASA
jgi:hypothetical protein